MKGYQVFNPIDEQDRLARTPEFHPVYNETSKVGQFESHTLSALEYLLMQKELVQMKEGKHIHWFENYRREIK
jgi:hypothetical protein